MLNDCVWKEGFLLISKKSPNVIEGLCSSANEHYITNQWESNSTNQWESNSEVKKPWKLKTINDPSQEFPFAVLSYN